jgi:hypothetical protein
MKIGFSFGRCLGSIVRGEISVDDVLVIIARTRMATEDHVRGVIAEYMHRPGYLQGLDQTECERVGVELFNSGRILEPRANNVGAGMSVPRDYIWMDLFPTAPHGTVNESVIAAWEQYRMLITMVEQLPEEGFIPEHGVKAIPLSPEELEAQKKAFNMLGAFVV